MKQRCVAQPAGQDDGHYRRDEAHFVPAFVMVKLDMRSKRPFSRLTDIDEVRLRHWRRRSGFGRHAKDLDRPLGDLHPGTKIDFQVIAAQ